MKNATFVKKSDCLDELEDVTLNLGLGEFSFTIFNEVIHRAVHQVENERENACVGFINKLMKVNDIFMVRKLLECLKFFVMVNFFHAGEGFCDPLCSM